MDWIDWDHRSFPFVMPCTYCPSHLTLPWEGLALYKLSHLPNLPKLSIPSQEEMDRLGSYQIHLLCPVLTVHPIPLYHGRDWTNNSCTVSHLLCPVHFAMPGYLHIQMLIQVASLSPIIVFNTSYLSTMIRLF